MTWADAAYLLQVVGLCAEVGGAILMAVQLISIARPLEWPLVFLSGLWRGRTARDAIRLQALNRENKLAGLQGLSLICLGFVLQAAGTLMTWLAAP